MVLSAVLFDLDGTLLDIDLDDFFDDYFATLGPVVAQMIGEPPGSDLGLAAVIDGTRAMGMPHPGQTNQEVFNARFCEVTGVDLGLEHHAQTLERFYAEVFPGLQGPIKPHAGARKAVTTALELGLKVAIATNPIFPRAAIDERMRWACISDLPVALVTSYEIMHAAKPLLAYYTEAASLLDVPPSAALMVGDDRVLDMTAADVGMRTFYVGPGVVPATDWSGTLEELVRLLPRLT